MNLLPLALGGLLGVGVLLAWRGLGMVRDPALDRRDQRRGLWLLNGGIVLAAVSMAGFIRFG